MSVHNYSLDFKGFKLQGNESTFEHSSGIYCVYSCVYNAERNTVSLKRLLYIGQAEDFNKRHANHDHKTQWEAELHSGEMLCYTRAELEKTSLDICEAALIFHYRPVCNGTADKNFHHDTTHIVMSGSVGLLDNEITVKRSAP